MSQKIFPKPLVLTGLTRTFQNSKPARNAVRPINHPEDLKGLKIRVPEGKVFVDTFNTLGAGAAERTSITLTLIPRSPLPASASRTLRHC